MSRTNCLCFWVRRPGCPCLHRVQYGAAQVGGAGSSSGRGHRPRARPVEAIAIKGDWIPLQTLLQWIPQIGDVANIRKLYYTTTVGPVEYALLSMHVSSRQNPDWVWGTFEHQMNPGRCDAIAAQRVFQYDLLLLQIGLGNYQILLAGVELRFGARDFNLRQRADLHLPLVVLEKLLGG